MRKSTLLLVLLAPSLTSSVFGQMLPFFTDTAQTVGFESNAVRTFSRFLVRSRLETEGERVRDPLERRVLVFAQVFAVPVRINSETVLVATTPILHKELALNPPGRSRTQLSDRGLGDTTLLIKRRFYVDNFQGGGLQATFIAGAKLPTGDHDERDDQGELLPPSLQLGTGSVDVPLGLIFTAFRHRIGFNSEVIHRFNGGLGGFQFGDETSLNLALGYRLFPREHRSMRDKVVNAYLEVNTSVARRASLNGQMVPDSGGTLIYLTPGLQWVLTPRFLVESAFQIPIVQQLNGSQLAFGPNANLGVRLQF